ncbi:D-arabinono-1,4-lactone oxidase [Zhihengliuella salsuginis]|uniref:Xylitol oxidase n=1 Tax=Zhihengliuella salsuginis TaxID=578222 RepID=A0ABQ3GLV1_9MICC|nr:D-arabinono-1,4-lactone oxidase [Zhihengliuella salsuginis]GHD10596.1 xylitol oxidase [Zhihengliuella salsuginis]
MEANWAGNLTYSAQRIVHPADRAELVRALAGDGEVRVVGSRHSFNGITDTAGTLIATDRLPAGVEVDGSAGSVRVGGGVRYGDLAALLAGRGLALGNLASLPHISVAGAIATGTHGSGDRLGSLATSVRALTLLTPGGDEVRYERGDEDFGGAVVHLGALGVVVEVELDVEPAYDVAQTVYERLGWDTAVEHLDAITSSATSVSLFTDWGPADEVGQIWTKQRSDAGEPPAAALLPRLGATLADGPRHPVPGGDTRASTEQGGAAGNWADRLPHFRLEFTPSNGDELQSEYFVPRADAPAAIDALRSLGEEISPLLQIGEVRTVRADDLWLSPACGQDTVAFHFTWVPDQPAVESLLVKMERVLPSSVRPHWGKLWQMEPADVVARFENWDRFAALRAQLDPERRLVNDFLRRFGL